MSNTTQEFIDIAKKEVGYKENGKHNNKYSKDKKPWSGDFIAWCANKAGIDLPSLEDVSSAFKELQKNNMLLNIRSDANGPQPGDIVFFSFQGIDKINEVAHAGICIKSLGDGVIATIEGNTSDNSRDNQRDGGIVNKKIRAWKKSNYKKMKSSIVGWYRVDLTKENNDEAEIVNPKPEIKKAAPKKKKTTTKTNSASVSNRMIRKGE